MRTELYKRAQKLSLSEEFAARIIAYDHELNNYIPKKRLVKMDLNLTSDTIKFVNKIARTLKVSVDAVVGMALVNYLQKEGSSDT